MPNRVEQPIVKTTYPQLNLVNDPYPAQTTPSQSGSTALYAAQLGMRVWLDGNPGGVKYSTTSPAVELYGGVFQYVQAYNGTTAPAVGQPAAWAYDQATVSGNVYAAFQNYIVTADTNSILRVGRIAGVFLNAITKGNYGWIQTKGLATVLFKTSISKTTPADGDLVLIDYVSGLADVPGDGTTVTFPLIKAIIGTAIGAPVSNQGNIVLLRALADVV